MRYTPQTALQKTLKLWEWLEDNPSCSKKVSAYINCNYLTADDLNFCPCCEYDKQQRIDKETFSKKKQPKCEFCQLYPSSDNIYGCETEGEPWFDWLYSKTIESRKEAAGRMVALVKQRLAEIESA